GGYGMSTPMMTREVFPLVDGRTGGVHWVASDAVDAGRRGGRYRAVCGVVVLAASLAAPVEAYCGSCVKWAVW
ncbi:MAG: hypothetical protein ACRD0E_10300, partial [Acidimicrobiales bacterium]